MSSQQLREAILAMLNDGMAVTSVRIAKRLGVDQGRVSPTLSQMYANGIVSRVQLVSVTRGRPTYVYFIPQAVITAQAFDAPPVEVRA
jgi:predicted ArsR family transcriptional regulator